MSTLALTVLWQTQEEKDAEKAKEEETKQEIQRLTDELTVLNQQTFRNKRMREVGRCCKGTVSPRSEVGLCTGAA